MLLITAFTSTAQKNGARDLQEWCWTRLRQHQTPTQLAAVVSSNQCLTPPRKPCCGHPRRSISLAPLAGLTDPRTHGSGPGSPKKPTGANLSLSLPHGRVRLLQALWGHVAEVSELLTIASPGGPGGGPSTDLGADVARQEPAGLIFKAFALVPGGCPTWMEGQGMGVKVK